MYAAPPSVTAEIFTEVPEGLRLQGRSSEWLYGRGGATPYSFLEGPSFDRRGNLWLTDIVFGRIFRVTPAGEWSVVAEYDGEPNGLAFHRDGWAAITDAKRGLLRLNPETGEVSPLLPRARREGFRGVNDCTFAKNGDLFFTDQGQTGLQDPAGRVYRLRAGASQADALISNVPSPNGLVLTEDAHTLYVAAPRDNAIWLGRMVWRWMSKAISRLRMLAWGVFGSSPGLVSHCFAFVHLAAWRPPMCASAGMRIAMFSLLKATVAAFCGHDGNILGRCYSLIADWRAS